jgi:hypothetical protein
MRTLEPHPIQPETRSSCSKATPFPPCSGTASPARRQGLDAAEGAGHLAQLELGADRRGRARDRRRPAGPGLRAGRHARPSFPTPSSNGCWPTWPCCPAAACPTASIRPTPPAGALPVRGLAHQHPVRGRRRAAGQGAGSARACRLLRKIVCSTWKACATWTTRRDQPRPNCAAGPRVQRRPSEDAVMQRVAAGASPEDLAILVYTSGTTGKPKGAMHSARGAWSTPCAATTR